MRPWMHIDGLIGCCHGASGMCLFEATAGSNMILFNYYCPVAGDSGKHRRGADVHIIALPKALQPGPQQRGLLALLPLRQPGRGGGNGGHRAAPGAEAAESVECERQIYLRTQNRRALAAAREPAIAPRARCRRPRRGFGVKAGAALQ